MAQGSVAICFLAALVLCIAEVSGRHCRFRFLTMMECIDSTNLDFNCLLDPNYKAQLCRGMEPVESCIQHHRRQCPRITTFRRKSGAAINTMLSSLHNVCADLGHQQTPQAGGTCQQMTGQFAANYSACFEPFNYAIRERHMCDPWMSVITCIKTLLRNSRRDRQLTDLVARQVQFGVDYMSSRWYVRYRCNRKRRN